MRNVIKLAAGVPLEFIGVLTLLTNEGALVPAFDLGFTVPVFLVSSDIQGMALLMAGAMITALTVMKMAR